MKKFLLPIMLFTCAILAYAAQDKVIQIFQNGTVIQSYPLESIDYIEINEIVSAPNDVNATVENDYVTITWEAVENATYNVYRSSDNSTFILLAENLSTTSYTDKVPLNGSNYYKVKAIVNGIESDYSSSTTAVNINDSNLTSGLYIGITGFNQALYNYPIMQLTESSKAGFDSFIDNLTMKNGTLLYYSVDEAISTLQKTQFPEDLFNVAIVTFTDGLDQGSMMMNSNYLTDEEYLEAVNNRIMNETVSGQSISAYSIGIRGSDVTDVDKFKANLEKLASSTQNATEVTSMTEVNARFQEIANQLNETSYVQTISLRMPGQANGTKVRFTFDNITSADKSQLFIEGVFNLQNKQLENVVYNGLTSTTGGTVQGTVDGIFVTFKFEGVRADSKTIISSNYINEWTFINSTSSWQINSEFDKEENSDIVNEKKSAAIMLLLDCSSSLDTQFENVKTNAKSFISTLCQSTEEPSEPEEPLYPSDNFSTTPSDLTLAVSKDSVRYYLTQEEYQSANLSAYTVEGLTIIQGDETFILSLQDKDCAAVTLSVAKLLYDETTLPTENQGVIMSARWEPINSALSAFGGKSLSGYYWTSGQYKSTYNGSGLLYNESSSNKNKIRTVKATSSVTPISWKDYRDLKIAVKKDSIRYFFSEEEYSTINLEAYEVEGLAVVNNNEAFILSLQDKDCGVITKSAAIQLYGESNLPTKNQAIVISARWSHINSALSKFNGILLSGYYWTSYGYYSFSNKDGDIYSDNSSATNHIRTVKIIE